MNSSSSSLPTSQPSPYAKTLVETLTPHAVTRDYPVRVRIALSKQGVPQCLLLQQGSLEVHRLEDDLNIVTINAPAIVGINNQNVSVVTAQPSKIATLPVSEAHKLIEEQGLWEVLAKHMLVINTKLFAYSKRLSAPSAYQMICSQLLELMSEPETLRLEITAERYIREKTHLSRSGVMKILSDLKNGNYIVLQEGRLIEIKHLPSKY